MTIREANQDDFQPLMAFYDYMCDILGKRDFLPDGNKGGFPSPEMVRTAIEEHQQFIGVTDGEIAAAYIMNHDCDPAYSSGAWRTEAQPEEVAVLHALRVLPKYGGRGYSRRLMEHAIHTARQRSWKAMRLDCIEGNDIPVRMYCSYGFEYVGTVPITYEDIGAPMPFRLYELEL